MWNSILRESTPMKMSLIFTKSPFSQPFHTFHQLHSWLENSDEEKKREWKCSNQNIFPYFLRMYWRERKEELLIQFISSPEIKYVFANHFSLYKLKALWECQSDSIVRQLNWQIILTQSCSREHRGSADMFSKLSIRLVPGQLFGIVLLLQITACPRLICHLFLC